MHTVNLMDFCCCEEFSSDVRLVWKFSYEFTNSFSVSAYEFCVCVCMCGCLRYLRFGGEISSVVIGNNIIGISNIRDMRSNYSPLETKIIVEYIKNNLNIYFFYWRFLFFCYFSFVFLNSNVGIRLTVEKKYGRNV